jgi:hypothetical protein
MGWLQKEIGAQHRRAIGSFEGVVYGALTILGAISKNTLQHTQILVWLRARSGMPVRYA